MVVEVFCWLGWRTRFLRIGKIFNGLREDGINFDRVPVIPPPLLEEDEGLLLLLLCEFGVELFKEDLGLDEK